MVSIKELIILIKKKKELSGVDDSIISDLLNTYIQKRNISIENLRKSHYKIIIKDIRAELRLYTGRFQKSTKDRKKLLRENKIEELAKTHSSTAERLEFYPDFKKMISKLKITSILDLACGLNPIMLADKKIKYYASDIKTDELELINQHFKKNKIKGKTFVYDLRKIDNKLPKAELCLLLKVLDILEAKGHKLAEEIIKKVPCKKIIVSFPTRKISGRPMNQPKRPWLEKLLTRLNYNLKIIKSKNEIFYLIEKS